MWRHEVAGLERLHDADPTGGRYVGAEEALAGLVEDGSVIPVLR